MGFLTFRHKSNGVIARYPEHYENHPVLGADLERYNADEYEEDKVVVEDHNIPAEQRARIVANKTADSKADDKGSKDN